MKAIFLFFFLISSSGIALSQKKTYTLEELKQIPKDSLIIMAVKTLNDPNFNSTFYDEVKIRSGIHKYDSTDFFELNFSPSILYKPKHSSFYSFVTVDMMKGSRAGCSIEGNWRDSREIPYYKPQKKHTRIIKFVMKAINKSDEIGHIPDGKLPKGNVMVIEKRTLCYSVRMDSRHTASFYKVQKITGKIYDARHKHKIADKNDED